MKATITKIHPLSESRTEAAYIRIEFQLDDEKKSWAKTDIVIAYRNYKRWKPVIKKGVGAMLTNLKMRQPNEVDGDSYPVIVNSGAETSQIEEVSTSGALAAMAKTPVWESLRAKLHPKT